MIKCHQFFYNNKINDNKQNKITIRRKNGRKTQNNNIILGNNFLLSKCK